MEEPAMQLPNVAAATSETALPVLHVVAHADPASIPEFYPGEQSFDAELIGEANQVTQFLDPSVIARPHAKATALAAQSQESQRDRATRYFATHGLRRVAQALGEDASETKVAHNDWRRVLSETDSKASATGGRQEQMSSQPSPWAAVDAIRYSTAKLMG
eukprot:2219988-Amphidinium_carterae.1